MSLKTEALDSWTTNKVHPASAPAICSSKRLKGSLQSTSDLSHHQKGKPKDKTPLDTFLGVSEFSKEQFATLALHADARSTATGCTFGIVDKLLTAAAKFDVDDVCGLMAVSLSPFYSFYSLLLLCCNYVGYLCSFLIETPAEQP